MQKLNQILAIEKGVKSHSYSEITKMHHEVQKSALLNGFSKTYTKKDEDGDDFPPEKHKVQVNAKEVLSSLEKVLCELLDVTFTKDKANCNAFANIEVDGKVILENVPVTYLLFLEKQLNDLRTFIAKIPILSTEEDWALDKNTNLYKTPQTKTTKTKKVQKPIVLYDATEKHPAQTQLITEDLIIGHWTTTKQSGALPEPYKKELLERVDRLSKAVKFAREEANSVEAKKLRAGEAIFSYIFNRNSK